MKRRRFLANSLLPGAMLAAGAVPVSSSAGGSAGSSGSYPRTASEAAAGVNPVAVQFPPGDVRRYGATGDGVTDDSGAFAAALVSSASVLVADPSASYRIAKGLVVPDNVTVRGSNRYRTRIVASGAIDLFTMGDGVCLENLFLDGNGQKSRGLVFVGAKGNQTIHDCRIVNFAGTPVAFATTAAGSRCSFHNVEAWHTNGASGSGNFAFDMASGTQLKAVPRKFSHIETAGYCAFNFGGCNDVFVVGSFLGDLAFTPDSRGVLIAASRVANQSALNINGEGVTFAGCAIHPAITISGPGPVVIQGSYCNSTISDGSSRGGSLVTESGRPFAPTWTAGSSDPAIGNGKLRGQYSRNGDVVTVAIEMIAGSTTTFGEGEWRLGVPKAPQPTSGAAQIGLVYLLNAGAQVMSGTAVVASGSSYLTMSVDSTLKKVDATTPWNWKAGDVLRVQMTYML